MSRRVRTPVPEGYLLAEKADGKVAILKRWGERQYDILDEEFKGRYQAMRWLAMHLLREDEKGGK